MNRVVLLFESKRNSQLLAEWLSSQSQFALAEGEQSLDEPFDLCIVDGRSLDRHHASLQECKEAEHPLFLPILCVTSRQNLISTTSDLAACVDEVIVSPVEKAELLMRIRVLLRTRQLSLQLNQRNQELTAFTYAVTHDLRSPLQVITSMAELLLEDQGNRLDDQGRQDLYQILLSADQMHELIAAFLSFSRLGREAIQMQEVSLQRIVASCINSLEREIRMRNTTVQIEGALPSVWADTVLLKSVIINLLSNSLKYVASNVEPLIMISASQDNGRCCLRIQDNGIGIALTDQQRIFAPFVRLKTVERPGVGLGLAVVRKSVELMSGRLGVESTPGVGSTFWVELNSPTPDA
jgi:signal transduction histidine kinase